MRGVAVIIAGVGGCGFGIPVWGAKKQLFPVGEGGGGVEGLLKFGPTGEGFSQVQAVGQAVEQAADLGVEMSGAGQVGFGGNGKN
ncbi:hypothetical protein AGQ48_24610 [Salmonella enterica subsp. enterica]|nr:hypothetical protein AGQ48_24610 [Salmonella enterica subsp. enterica]